MPAVPKSTPEFLGIPESVLAAERALATAREIEQQPRMLRATLALVAGLRARIDAFAGPLLQDPRARVVLTGAGTSSFIGLCLAPLLDRQISARVEAIATTDLVASPRLHLDPAQPLLLVSFGRSGNSPESLAAVALVEATVADARHLVVTCNPDGGLATVDARAKVVLQLPEETHDESFAMTSSFSCMMLATLAALSTEADLPRRVEAIANATDAVIDRGGLLQALAGQRFERVAWLGSGVFAGLAREAALKLGELTNGAVATAFDTPLGFRHGPKTFVRERTLVAVFVSNDPSTRPYDLDLVDELRADGVAARVVEVMARPRDGAAGDAIVVPGLGDAADVDLLWPYVAAAQLFAFHASRALGLTPDNPNPAGVVNRVVQGVRIHPVAG